MQPLIRELAASIRPQLQAAFSFFGHSMGALVAFELARSLRLAGLSQPSDLFVSGCPAPQVFDIQPKIHQFPDEQFIDRIRRLDGTPSVLLQNRELMRLVLPGLRADFAVCETYTYAPAEPLTCPVFAFGGDADAHVSREKLESWRDQTTAEFHAYFFSGNHFFLFDHGSTVFRAIGQRLAQRIMHPRGAS